MGLPVEPEVSIGSPDKAGAEAILLKELVGNIDALPDGRRVMPVLPSRAT